MLQALDPVEWMNDHAIGTPRTKELYTMVKPFHAQLGAVVANAMLWITTPVLAANISDASVTESEITVSLPVYILSIIGTASFTWVVAKYDNERIRKMDRLASQMERLLKERESK